MAKKKFKYSLYIKENEEITRCCGLVGIGGLVADFFDDNEVDLVQDNISTAILATTVPSQVHEIKALKERGFKALKKFKNPSTGRIVTIWYRKSK